MEIKRNSLVKDKVKITVNGSQKNIFRYIGDVLRERWPEIVKLYLPQFSKIDRTVFVRLSSGPVWKNKKITVSYELIYMESES